MGAEEGPRGGTPGGLKHMAVVDTGSFQQFEVVRIIFRTYSYPELSEISERFLILLGKLAFRLLICYMLTGDIWCTR